MPHCMTLCLVISQLVACIGALLWDVMECKTQWQIHLQFIMFTVGVFSSRVWTALLAVSLLLLRWRSLCFALRIRTIFAIFGWGVPAALVTILCVLEERESDVKEKTDPNFQYGRAQATTACIVLLCSLVVTVTSLIIHQRYERRNAEYHSLLHDEGANAEYEGSKIGINDTRVPIEAPSAASSKSSFTLCRGEECHVGKHTDGACCLQDVEDICFNANEEPTPGVSSARDRYCYIMQFTAIHVSDSPKGTNLDVFCKKTFGEFNLPYIMRITHYKQLVLFLGLLIIHINLLIQSKLLNIGC